MRDEQNRLLSLLGQAPMRLTAEQAAWVLNCQVHDIPVLIAARLLKPLGNPPANGTKFFSTAEVLELAKERSWLARVTDAIYARWRQSNRSRRNGNVHRLPSPPPRVLQGRGAFGADQAGSTPAAIVS